MEREEEWGWTGADRATHHMQMQRMEREEHKRAEFAEHAPNEWGWENELHSGTKISEELPETPGCGLPWGCHERTTGLQEGIFYPKSSVPRLAGRDIVRRLRQLSPKQQ